MARDTSKLVTIPGELHSAATGNIVAAAEEVFDYTTNKYQKDINQEVAYIKEDSSVDPIPSFNPQSQTVHVDEQVLSNAQKKQVRKNIGLGNGDIDSTPTSGSDNVVRSGGVYSSMQELRSTVNPQVGYYTCSTAGDTAAKVIDASGYTLLKGGGLRVNFTEKNTAANATLNIEQTGAKPLYYNGVRVSTNNSWYAGEVMTLFYDGAAFQLNSLPDLDEYDVSARNGGQAFTFDEAVALVPEAYRHGGLKLRFISNNRSGQSSDNRYVQYRLIKNTWSTIETDWQGVDDKPTTGSDNLVKSRGVADSINKLKNSLQPYIINSSNDTIEGNIANGIWYSNGLSFIVPLIPGKSLSITGNSQGVYYSILKTFPENIVIGATPDFATGYSDRVWIEANRTVTKIVPSDGEFLIIAYLGNPDAIPTSIIVNGIPYDTPIHKKIATIEDSLKQSISKLDSKDNFILNSLKNSVIWNKGYIDDNGNTKPIEGRYYTNLLPVVDGYGYETWGTDIVNVIYYYYSAPYIDSEYFLGKDATGELLSTAKYVSIYISNVQDIENVKVISNRETTKLLINAPFKCPKSTFSFLYPEQRITFLNFVLFAVKGFYFYGESVNSDYDYTIGFVKSGTSLRVLIYLEETTIIDKTIAIPEDGIIDKTETVSGYNFRIIADCNNFADFNSTVVAARLFLNKNAFSPIIGNPLALETSVKELNTLKADVNDPDKIIINDGLGDIVDYLEYLTLEKGSTTGAIVSSTGAPTGNPLFTRTDYVSLKGIYAVKVTTPKGSSAGLAFYTGNDVSKYAEQYISGVIYDTGGDGNTWIPVPNGARYFRTTVLTTDISDGTAVLQVHKYATKSIQEYISSVTEQLVPRATHVLFGYEWFLKGIKQDNNWSADTKYLEKSRNTYVVETEDENAKQMISDTQLYLNKMQIEAHFEVGSSDAFFGIGTISSGAVIQNEARIHNVDGNAVFEVYSGVVTSSDTYGQQDPRAVISRTMSFALTEGNTYKLGMRKFENETHDNVEHMDGVIYYVKSLSDDILYEEFVPRNSTVNNDIRNGITASCKGSIYVSVKKGTVTVDNIFVSSEYNPQAKVLMLGDSYTDGDTLIGTDTTTGCGQKNKFACLLQSAIGDKSFVIAGKGGDGVFLSSIPYLKNEVKLFCPGYCILQYGANHSDLDIYKTNMEEFTRWLESLGIKPILVTTPPVNGIPIERITQMNDWVKNSGYRYVDQCKAVSVDGAGLVWKDGYVYSDGVHPTALGHKAVYEAFVKELPELFSV